MSDKFRNISNQLLTRELFHETAAKKDRILFTLRENDYDGLPSLRRLYMEANDPTEYQFAIEHLEGYQHWETLCKCAWFKPYVERWRKELELMVRSYGLKNVMKAAAKDGKDSFQASKYLADRGWDKTRSSSTRGRPSRKEIHEQATRMAEDEARQLDDLERIIN